MKILNRLISYVLVLLIYISPISIKAQDHTHEVHRSVIRRAVPIEPCDPYIPIESRDTIRTCLSSYTWNGTIYTLSGDYHYDASPGVRGCDSIAHLHLEFLSASTGDTMATGCEAFIWYGTTYTTSGDYTYHMTNAAGCDSVVTLHLTIKHAYEVDDGVTICPSALPYSWETETFTEAGTKTITLTAQNGCDSVVHFTLTVNEVTTGEESIAVQGSAYMWHGTTYTDSGDYTYHMTNAAGCDSVVTLHLTLLPEPVVAECRIKALISDIEACFPTSGSVIVQLNTDREADYYLWRGSNLSDSTARNPLSTLTAAGDDEYRLEAMTEYGNNLVYNGDFELGNVGFSTDYTYHAASTKISMGEYKIVNISTQEANSNFADCQRSGKMLVVDGNEAANKRVFSTEIDVEPETYYAFSCYVTTVYDKLSSDGVTRPAVAQLQFFINNETLSDIYTLSATTCRWQKIYKLWYSGTSTHISLSLLNHCMVAFGNDFAVDDIMFRPLCVARDTVSVSTHVCCDSIEAHVTVSDVCGDERSIEVVVDVQQGTIDQYTVQFEGADNQQYFRDTTIALSTPLEVGTHTLSIPIQQGSTRVDYPQPDSYTIRFSAESACGATFRSGKDTFEVFYPSWLIDQRWNDVLSLMNERYNGGYTFSQVEWLRNGEVIAGETGYYLYVPHELRTSPVTHEAETVYYQARLTREGDGKTILTCPLYPTQRTSLATVTDPYVSVYPTSVPWSEPVVHILTNTEGIYYVYDVSGRLVQKAAYEPCEHNAFMVELPLVRKVNMYVIVFAPSEAVPSLKEWYKAVKILVK